MVVRVEGIDHVSRAHQPAWLIAEDNDEESDIPCMAAICATPRQSRALSTVTALNQSKPVTSVQTIGSGCAKEVAFGAKVAAALVSL